MLRLDPLELIQLFRRPGGAEFAAFVNDLIQNACRDAGIPISEIFTCSRTDAKDGGVDTRVARASATDDTGYLVHPTIWQTKAADEANISDSDLEKEVNKPHAKACIEQGYGYVLCVCDHLTDQKRTGWLNALVSAIKGINPNAPRPRILGVDDLAALANRYPPMLMTLRPALQGRCSTFNSLRERQTALTRIFVPTSGFDARKSAILKHVDLQQQVPTVVLTFQGVAGVGKTRTVYECLSSLPYARSLVLYTDDEEQAAAVGTLLANDPTAHAILLADDCSLSVRQALQNILNGCKNRVRVVAIDNSGELTVSVEPELAMKQLTSGEVEQVLRENFPTIPQDRLRTYAYLAEGFIRLAADMCNYDPHIAAVGSVQPVMAGVHEYFRERLSADQRKAVEAVALLKRVGHKDDAQSQLDSLCLLTSLKSDFVEAQLDSVKDIPGFVERGARYYRVTPEIIAIVAFQGAWKRWAEGKEETFLQRIPENIQESFLQRVAEIPDAEVRKTVQGFFRRFADNFTARDLVEIDLVNRFIKLIETDPTTYLPMLRRVVDSADHEQLTSSKDWTGRGWGPRRQLVWLAERFAQFPEFFYEAEAILYKLSVHECEQSIGNNASAIWQQLFRFQLSGTALPLKDRLTVLHKRLASVDEMSAAATSGALKGILNFMGSRMLGPPVVGGRIPPPEWHPRDLKEQNEAIEDALVLLKEAAKAQSNQVSKAAEDAILGDIEMLAYRGYLDVVQRVFTPEDLPEHVQALLVSELTHRIERDSANENKSTRVPDSYLARLRDWISKLEPKTLHGKLVEAVGGDPWKHFGREGPWRKTLRDLAELVFHDEPTFATELAWLLSSEAKAAFEFGQELGSLDKNSKYLRPVISGAVQTDQSAFPRGYVTGLVYGANSGVQQINEELDRLENESPKMAFEIAHAGGNATRIFERTLRLIKDGKLPATYLRNFAIWVGNRKIEKGELLDSLQILLPLARDGNELCSDVMVDFLGYQQNEGNLPQLMSNDSERSLVWEVLTVAAQHLGREAHWWSRVLSAVAPTDHIRAIRLACSAAMSDNFGLSDEALMLVSQFGNKYPQEVMDEIGKFMLNESVGWKFFTRKYQIFAGLPFEVVTQWLAQHGVDAARKIARHIPKPSLDPEGHPTLHPLTEFVLSQFEDDDRTFSEFCAGVHSLQMYVGDYASAREQEAEVAKKFFNHPLRRVREWAQREYEFALREAQHDREREDEMNP